MLFRSNAIGTGLKFDTKFDFKRRIQPHTQQSTESSKKLDDENRSLRIKLKSIESQLAKNEDEAASKIAK